MSGENRNKADALRERAEDLLARSPEEFHPSDLKNVSELAHELAVHQAELEIQNEELQNTQLVLQKAKERYNVLYEHAPVGYVVLDAAGIIRQTNRTMLSLLSREEEDLRGKPFSDVIIPDDTPIFLSRFRTFFRNPEKKQIIVRMRRKGSRPFYAQIEASPQFLQRLDNSDEERSNQELMVIVSDISELHKTQHEIEDRNRELQQANDRIEHINRVLLGIRNVNQLIVSEDDPFRLIEGACKNLTETMGYLSAIMVLLDDTGHKVTAAAASGFKDNFESLRKRIMSGDIPQCMRQSLRSDKTIVVTDPVTQCSDCSLSSEYGERSTLCIRLSFEEKIYGMLTVSIPRNYVTIEEEQGLFNEVAGDLAFALHKIKMAERLLESQREMKHAQTIANIGSWRFDLDAGKVIASEETRRIYGIDDSDLSIEHIQKIPLPQYRDYLDQALYKLIHHGVPYNVEFEICRHSDNAIKHIHSIAEYDHTKNMIIGTIQDITDRKKVEERLVRNKAELKAIYDNAQVMLCVLDEDRHVLYANPSFTSFTGVSQDELRAGRACGVFGCVNAHDDTRGCGYGPNCPDCVLFSALEGTLKTGIEHKNIEVHLSLDRDGKCHDVILLASTTLIRTDTRKNLLLCLNDITELKQAEKELRATTENLQAILDYSPLLISEINVDGSYVRVNAATAESFGQMPSSLIGTSFVELLPEDTVKVFMERIARVTETRKPLSVEDHLGTAGAERHYLTTLYPLFDDRGNIRSIGTIAHDITERVQAENSVLQQSERLKALVEIFQYQPETIQDFLDQALEKAISLTKSKIGYVYFYDENRKMFELNSWSKNVMKECAVVDPQTCYELDKTGIWGETVRQRKPIVLNDFQSAHPLKKGYPEGHVSLTRFLSVPVFHDEQIVAVVGVANKNTDYDETNVLELTLLMDSVWKSIESIKNKNDIQEREHYLSTILQTTADGFWVINSEGHVTEVNNSYCTMSGYARQELLGMGIGDLDAQESAKQTQVRMKRVIKNGSEIFETIHRRKDGSVFPVEVTTTYLPDDGGQFVCFCRDLTERKQHEERISLLGRMLDAAPASITIHNEEGHFVFANRATLLQHGYDSIEDFLSVNLHELDVPESEELLEERFRQIAEKGEARFEVAHYRKDGSAFPLEILAKSIDWHGEAAILSIGVDISMRKQAEAALNEASKRLHEAIRAGDVGLWDWDLATNRVEYSTEWKQQIGYEEHEIGDGFEEWEKRVHPDDLESTKNRIIKAIDDTDQGYQVEFRFRHKNGSYRWILARSSVFCDQAGNPIRVLGSHIDITDRKQTEEELKRRESELQQIFEILPIGLWLADKNGTLIRGNPAGVKIWGAEPHVPISEYGIFKAWRIPSGEPIEPDDWALAKTIRNGETIVDELLEIESFDGIRKTILNYTAPVLDNKGMVNGAIVINLDISDRHALENQLRQAQKMEAVGRLAGGVAHDFNNMVSIIIGNAELILSNLDHADPHQEEIEEILNAAKRSADLTRQLLAFARKQTVTPKVLDLNKTIESMLKMLQRLIGEDIHLHWKPAKNLGHVNIDPSQIDQILANLVVNACDAIGHKVGNVTIETDQAEFDEDYCATHAGFVSGEYVMLSVSDDGCGMDEETKASIFEPFFTTKSHGEGTGLGLATVYGIVKQNQGFIYVYSEPNQGATFKIFLPVHRAHSTDKPVKQKHVKPTKQGHETILLVEDEPSVLILGIKILERSGYQVIAASTPGEAIQLAREHVGNFNLLITDVVMPEMNGRDLAKAILSMYPDIKLLFMSGYTANVIAHRGVLDEGVNFIQKPFSMQGLNQKVRDVLDG